MDKSHEILKAAIERIGVKQLANELSLSQSIIYKWCQDAAPADDHTPSGSANPLDRIKKIYEMTGDESLVRWLCRAADGYFVKNPQKPGLSCEADTLKNIQKLIKEFSEVLDAISESYHSGRKISLKEAKIIRREWEELKSIGEGFARACERGTFDGSEKEKRKKVSSPDGRATNQKAVKKEKPK